MRREGVSYQEMFRRIKNTLITQRKVIRAAGRDTGDAMKLSRDKVNDMSHKMVAMLRKSRERAAEEAAQRSAARNGARDHRDCSQPRTRWTARRARRSARRSARSPKAPRSGTCCYRRYYAEELKKLGIDLIRDEARGCRRRQPEHGFRGARWGTFPRPARPCWAATSR